MELIIPAVVIVLIMFIFTFFMFKNLVKRINNSTKKYFLDKLQDFDYIIAEKEKEIEILSEQIKRLNEAKQSGEKGEIVEIPEIKKQEEKIDKRAGENQRNHANRHESSPLKERKIKIHAKKHRITKNLTNVFCFQIFPAVLYCGTSEEETSFCPICQRKNPVRANSAAASADAPQRKHRHMIMTGKFKNHQGE